MREVCPSDSAGVGGTVKERMFLLRKSVGMSEPGFAL